jgi:uroporphyrinogen-III synthase
VNADNPKSSFGGLEVAAFESRHAKEMGTLISRYGGVPRVAPSVQEVPLEDNPVAFEFADQLIAGQFDAVVFMTGVGTRALMRMLESRHRREQITQALAKTLVVARGPKSVRALQDLHVPVGITLPDPHTSQILLRVIEEHSSGFALEGSRIAIQEYGVSNRELLEELGKRGAQVFPVPVYRWALPGDTRPLRDVVSAIIKGSVHVVLFTNAVQADHLVQIAQEIGVQEELQQALTGAVVCSVGPVCSEALRNHGIAVEVEPEQHKMGALVYEAANRCRSILAIKRRTSDPGSGVSVGRGNEQLSS